MRWIAILLLLAVLLAAAACEEEDVATDEGATPTTARDATDTPPLPVATVGFYQLPTAEPITEEVAQQLRSLAPTEDEVGVAFPDLAAFEQELRGDLGQEYEHVDLAKHGFVAGYTAFYRPSDESHPAYISFALFDEASGASGSFDEIRLEQTAVSTFEVSEGDEAHGYTIPASQDEPAGTVVLLRQDRVVAFVVLLHPNGEDRREGMRQLARDVAGKIEDGLAQ